MNDDSLSIQQLLNMGPMANVANPYPLYAKLRNESPIVPIDDMMSPPDSKGSYMVTRYDDVKHALREDKTFGSDIVQRTMGIVMGPTIVGMNGKEHLKHRTIVTPSLAPRSLRGGNFPDLVQETAHKLIDAFASRGTADLHSEFAFSYPLTVFVNILGLPPEDVDQVHRWGIDLIYVVRDPEKGLIASEKLLNYLTPIVQEKRQNPGSDLISTLIRAEVDGEQLSDFEIVSFLRLLTLAGAETTNHLIGSAFFVLLKDPELMERVRADRSLVSALLHETMRWESPISTVSRETIEDTEIGGVEIPKGCSMLIHIGSANRDERKFPNPDVFDIDRDTSEHIAFGFGKHFCAGSHLAKMEAEVAVNILLDRLQDLKPVGNESNVIGFSFRGPDKIPVSFRAS